MKRWITLAAAGLMAGLSLINWHMAHADEEEEAQSIAPQQRVFTQNGVTYVKLAKNTQKAIGLETTTLGAAQYRATLRAYGRVVDLDALLSSYRQLSSAREHATQTHAMLASSYAEYRRLDNLYRQQRNVSAKKYQAARAAWLSDQAAATAADAQYSAVTNGILAQWGPTISQWLLKDNQHFQALTQSRNRLLRLTLPLGKVPADQPHSARVLLGESATVPVMFVSPAPSAEPNLPGQSYYFLATSDVDRLSYGLRISALIPNGPEHTGVIIPEPALVWAQGSAWAYIQTGTERFVRKPVRTDHPVPGGWFEASGLSPGTRVVTQGAQVLLSVEALASTPGGSTGGEGDMD